MVQLILFLVAIAFIIWGGYEFNRDLPVRVRQSVRTPRWFSRRRQQHWVRQFQEWLTLSSLYEQHPLFQGLPAEQQMALTTWFKELDEAAFKTLFARTQRFCNDANLKLRWLLSDEANPDPVLTEGVAASVVAYLIAYWEAHELQDRVATFQRYEAWRRQPTNRRNRTLTQGLFSRLSTRGEVQALPADLALASQKQRLNYMVTALQQVAERDIETIYRAIEALEERNSAPVLRTRVAQFTNRFRRPPKDDVDATTNTEPANVATDHSGSNVPPTAATAAAVTPA